MTTATRPRVEELLDRLADKTLSFGCEVEYLGEKYLFVEDDDILEHRLYSEKTKKTITKLRVLTKVSEHRITIGHVLAMMKEIDPPNSLVSDSIGYWGGCGFIRSLQEIVERSGWDKIIIGSGYCSSCETEQGCSDCNQETLKDPNAQKLFENLISIFETHR